MSNASTDDAGGTGTGTDAVQFTVVRGNPTAQELAAVTAVVSALAESSGTERMPTAKRAGNDWSQRARIPGNDIRPGHGAWNRVSW